MTRLGRSSRGFSLFTPLVGTALVIMAILIATTMIQNDVRISRTITASYEISSQSIAAKLIKATVELQILTNIESILYDVISNPREFEIVCSNEDDCINKAKDVLNNPHDTFMTEMTTGAHGMYSGVIDSIYTVTGYTTSITDNDLAAALSRVSAAGKTVVLVGFSDYVIITINEADIEKYAGDALKVSFDDKRGNVMVVSIVPGAFSYTTKEPIWEMVTKTADAFDSMTDNDVSSLIADDLFKQAYFEEASGCYTDSSAKSAKVVWRLDNGKFFTVTFKTSTACI